MAQVYLKDVIFQALLSKSQDYMCGPLCLSGDVYSENTPCFPAGRDQLLRSSSVQPQSVVAGHRWGVRRSCFVHPLPLFGGLEFHPKLKVKQFLG